MIANIDGDVIVYEAGFASETSYYSVADGEDFFAGKTEAVEFCEHNNLPLEAIEKKTKPGSWASCIANVNKLLTTITEGAGCENRMIFLTGKGNYREESAKSLPEPFNVYKGNRDDSHKPFWYQEIKEYLFEIHNAKECIGYEADDALATHQSSNTVLCTIDKDLDMIPGWHYNWRKSSKYFVSVKDAFDFYYIQLVTGDMTDNIPGLYKLTGQKATKKIKEAVLESEEPYEYIESLYGEDNVKYLSKIRELILIGEGPYTKICRLDDLGGDASFYRLLYGNYTPEEVQRLYDRKG